MRLKFLSLLSALGLLAGCSTGALYPDAKLKPALVPPPGKALVLVYAHDLPDRKYKLFANDRLITEKMGPGKFVYFYASPGEWRLASTGNRDDRVREDIESNFRGGHFGVGMAELARHLGKKKDLIAITTRVGGIYYVEIHRGNFREVMDQISTTEAEENIRDCHLADRNAIINP